MIGPAINRLSGELQARLLELYALDHVADVRCFMTTDRALVHTLEGAAHRPANEKLLIAQEADELFVSLFLDPELLERLAREYPRQGVTHATVADFWDLAEGVSHFTLLAWSAAHAREVSALELELQAEIDKFVLAALAARAERPGHVLLPLHRLQFTCTTLDPLLTPAERERYATANRYAARYCLALASRLGGAQRSECLAELRRFYRLPRGEKLRHIAAATPA
ncbi:MAG TPA: hypothetical protein VNL72_04355 [Gammaproteobacteria bacterium]|nr:hypothetical protein [Gammaproteobacteria bacterium]